MSTVLTPEKRQALWELLLNTVKYGAFYTRIARLDLRTLLEAFDESAALKAENERLREALEPFAALVAYVAKGESDTVHLPQICDYYKPERTPSVKDIRAAAAALSPNKEGGEDAS